MIGDTFLNAVFYTLNLFFTLLSFGLPATLPSGIYQAATLFGGYTAILNPIVPWSTLLTAITLVFSVDIAIATFKGLRWVWSHIPFIGGRG